MADSALYDSNSDISSVYDEGHSEDESLDGLEGAADGSAERQDDAQQGSDEQSRTASQAAKAIEAAREQGPDPFLDDSDHAVAGTSHNPYATAARKTAWDDDMPILDAGPAPPDYFAATAWRRSSPTNPVETHPGVLAIPQYQQDPETQPREDQRDLETESREAEATSSHGSVALERRVTDNVDTQDSDCAGSSDEAELDETIPLLRPVSINATTSKPKKKIDKRNRRRRHFYVCLAAFIVVSTLVATLSAFIRNYKTPEILKHPDSHGIPGLDHPKTASCTFDSYSDYIDFKLGDAVDFALVDDIKSWNQFRGRELKNTAVTSNVEVVYLPQNSSLVRNSPIVIRAHMATVLPWKVEMEENVSYYKGDIALLFGAPNFRRSSRPSALFSSKTSPPCLDVLILVYVREGTVLERLDINLFSLNFIDHEGAIDKTSGTSLEIMPRKARLFVTNQTDISSHRGDISLKYWSSNDTSVGSWDGSITGTYQMHTYMSLRSENGNIDVDIDSPLGNENGTGSIEWPWRYEGELRTLSTMGDTKVQVQQPSTHQNSSDLIHGGFLENIRSTHASMSGSISLRYPSDWSGFISGSTYNGNVSISGDEVDIFSDKVDRSMRTVNAVKGVGSRFIEFVSQNGEAALYIGDDQT